MSYADIAAEFGHQHATVRKWHHRSLMPAPALYHGDAPRWHRGEVISWARDTQRDRGRSGPGLDAEGIEASA